jgi:hypothetical protein
MNVKKTQMLANVYLKFETTILFAIVVALLALMFAVSSARGATTESADLMMVDTNTNIWRMQSADRKGGFAAVKLGSDGDVRVPADYDGDGIVDAGVWNPKTGIWTILKSTNGSTLKVQWGKTTPYSLGGIEDIPVPADYDGDKIADIAVWRPDGGRWFVLTSKTNFQVCEIADWGLLGDVPVPADYDGDGRTDMAVFRSMENRWYIAETKTGSQLTRNFGIAGEDLLVPADYTGDGKADIAVFRKGVWYVQEVANGETDRFEFGYADSVPVPADYDGDGTTDFAVYRNGSWTMQTSLGPRLQVIKFGKKSEVPLNSLSVKPSMIAVP